MPNTVHGVLAARIDQLPPAAKQVLQTAAVIGTEVRMSLLQAITALPEEALWQGLQHLHHAEFLYETRPAPDRTYAFKHVLTQEAAYQSLLKRTRQQVHQQIAQVLEVQFPATADDAARSAGAALHRRRVSASAKQWVYWQRAGARSKRGPPMSKR